MIRPSMARWALVSCVLLFSTVSSGREAVRPAKEKPQIAIPGPGVMLHSAGSAQQLFHRESAGPDTFDLYGGPRRVVRDPDGIPGNGDEYVEGKFEDPSGSIPRGLSPSPNDWTGVDLTDVPIVWQVSTFNAATLNDNGPGNRAAWVGLDAGQGTAAGWHTAPGYGNKWDAALVFESSVIPDPETPRTIALEGFFHVDVEPNYDFFTVAFDSAGTWVTVLSVDGTNKDPMTGVFAAPGLQLSTLIASDAIRYEANAYPDDRVRIRLRFESDSAFSDQDGSFDSDGAVQIDDLRVTIPGLGVFAEDFESGLASASWQPVKQPFAGDFSMLFTDAREPDPCAENRSPQVGFMDFGQVPPNAPGTTGTMSTGGSVGTTTYGIPGAWVVNYTGGLDGVPLANEVWSPAFAWDLPGPDDDGADVYGSALSFTVWRHQPLANGIFNLWHVRSKQDGEWSPWQ